jgi:type I restriction-modification system DNA methylase subunit
MDDDGSHVDVDFQLQREAVDDAERKPVKAEKAKPQPVRGGFDAIVGNPPYVDLKGMPPVQIRYLFDHYASANNRVNLFAAFIEKALRICSTPSGRFSMIVPTSLLTQDSYKTLRRLVTDRYHIVSICRLPNESFGEAAGDVKVDTMVVVLEPPIPNPNVEVISYSGYDRVASIDPSAAAVHTSVKQADWSADEECVWSLNLGTAEAKLLKKIETGAIALEQCAEFCLGLTPYDKYKGHTRDQIEQQVFHASSRKDKTYKKLLSGNDVRRYDVSWNGERWISYGPWLGAPREPRFFTSQRILVKQIMDWTSKRIWAALTDDELYNTQNAFNLIPGPEWAAEYLLGVLNSKLMTFYHQKKFLDEFKMRFQKILIKDCRRFPIHRIDSGEDAIARDKMVSLVGVMHATRKQLFTAKTDSDRTYLEDKCAGLDRQIDQLVYELYGLTEEEIALVEGT